MTGFCRLAFFGAAIQEQQVLITSQRKTIAEQENRIASLEAQAEANHAALERLNTEASAKDARINDLAAQIEKV